MVRRSDKTRLEVVNVIEHTYGPILGLMLFGILFAFVDAGQEAVLGWLDEAYQLLGISDLPPAETMSKPHLLARLVISVSMILALPFVAFGCMKSTLEQYLPDGRRNTFFLLAAPNIYALLIATGIVKLLVSDEGKNFLLRPDQVETLSSVLLVGAMLIGLAFLSFGPDGDADEDGFRTEGKLRVVVNPMRGFIQMVARRQLAFMTRVVDKAPRTALGLVWLGYIVLVGLVFPEFAVAFGPISIAASFAITVVWVLNLLTFYSFWMPGRLPIIFVVLAVITAMTSSIALLVVSGLLGVLCVRSWHNNNWYLRSGLAGAAAYTAFLAVAGWWQTTCVQLPGCNLIAGTDLAETAFDTPTQALETYEATRPKQDNGLRYEIIAAQGGGLYAAYQAAYYLATRADVEPDFTERLFAVSGISGGSVGAGVYWAIRKSGVCDRAEAEVTCHRDAVNDILKLDYLSPAFAGLMFRDNLDNLLPVSAFAPSPIDRGAVFEKLFVQRVARWADKHGVTDSDLLNTPMSGSVDLAKGVPILILSATRVDTGTMAIASPFQEINGKIPGRILNDTKPDLAVKTAMVLSARFPLITPPGRIVAPKSLITCRGIKDPDDREECEAHQNFTVQYADGGYFDNSGLQAAFDLVNELKASERKFAVTSLTSTEIPQVPDPKGTIGAPVGAFFAAWRARSARSYENIKAVFPPNGDAATKIIVNQPFADKPDKANFTLSWYLTEQTFFDLCRRTEEQLGVTSEKARCFEEQKAS